MAVKYKVIELGTLGGEYSEAFAINNQNQIVGRAALPFVGSRACIWQPLEYNPFNLGGNWTRSVPAVQLTSTAIGISPKGKIVGWAQKGGPEQRHAQLYDGQAKDLTNLLKQPGSLAWDINSADLIVGSMGEDAGDWTAFKYDLNADELTPITWPGTAKAVNSIGQVAGVEYDPSYGGWRAFIYHNGQITYITEGPGNIGNALDINDAGDVVGEFNFNPFLYAPASEGLKPTLQILDAPHGIAIAINSVGHVVGYSSVSGQKKAWIYTKQDGVVMLDTRIEAASGWELIEAHDINRDGYVVGVGRRNGKTRGFLLVPPEAPKPEWWHPFDSAIDPLALVLSGKAYDILTEINHPHEPKEKIQEKLRSLTVEDRRRALSRATTLLENIQSFEDQADYPRVYGPAQLEEILLTMTNEQRRALSTRAQAILESGRALEK